MLDTQNPKPCRLVVVETHPIQYKAPLFRLMAQDPRFDLTVLYAMIPDASQQGTGFGVSFAWDVPLLDGYHYEVLENRSKNPSVAYFSGCDTPGIVQRLKELRPDAVLVNGWVVKTCLQTLIACRRLGIPCMVRGEANLLRPRAWWKHRIHDLLLPWYSAYLAIGSASRQFYQFHGIQDEKIFFAPYAVDNCFFAVSAKKLAASNLSLESSNQEQGTSNPQLATSNQPPVTREQRTEDGGQTELCSSTKNQELGAPPRNHELRTKNHEPGASPRNQEPDLCSLTKNQKHELEARTVFAFVGKLEEKKHPMHLLQAFAALTSEERAKAHVLIAGDGPLMAECREFVQKNQLPVTFAGFVNQSCLPEIYAAADVLVLPSDAGETWGLVVNEAMASGLPAMVSRSVGCCQDLIVEGQTGFAFDLGDLDALTENLRRYISNPGLAKTQGIGAAKHIQQFGLTQILDGMADAAAFCTRRDVLC